MRTTPLVVLSVLAGAASVAGADTVTVVFDGISGNLGQSVTVQLSGGLFFGDGGSSHGLWVGQLSNTIEGVPNKTFCTELTQWAGSGEFEVVTVDQAPNPGNAMGQTKADAIYRLYNATDRGGDITTNAMAALVNVRAAITQLAADRATIGAYQARMNFTSEQLTVSKENLSAASSRIQDVDVAEESTQYARYNILVQSGTAMLAQANTIPQSALRLLQ